MRIIIRITLATVASLTLGCGLSNTKDTSGGHTPPLQLTDESYFSAPGADILVFNNAPGGLFSDAKTSGIEIIHHGERTVTNGDVRLAPTPEQWDGLAELESRSVDAATGSIRATLVYPNFDFRYHVVAAPSATGVAITVELDEPLPASLVGKAGFNLEFLPSVYWDKTFLADGTPGQMPRSASNHAGMTVTAEGRVEPLAIARGRTLVLAPEDPEARITLRAANGTEELGLYDGRSKAQNGWFVVRSQLPAGRTGTVLQWQVEVNTLTSWVRAPVIGFSQAGYHPAQTKTAVIELDPRDASRPLATLWRIHPDGRKTKALQGKPQTWGDYLRYAYLTFDFSEVREAGVYQLQYGQQQTEAFTIGEDLYARAWQPTLDFFFPVQMDHMKVKEAYRTWHGVSHLDDALQAPANYEHFDLYAHDGQLDSPYKPFEHIPGLNIGGWYDAGDYDIRTQSQYHTVLRLVQIFEEFNPQRDNTTVDQAKRYVQINRPDGRNDLQQQIEHGTLALIAQHRALGHAIPGIVAGRLYQYPHLGDGSTKTDNLIYRKSLDPHALARHPGKMYEPSTVDPTPAEDLMPEEAGHSGRFDDRWAFTSNTTALNYGSAAALAAASRALEGFNDALARECLATAKRVWTFEAGRTPNAYRFGNTTGGRIDNEKLQAALQLLLATGERQYAGAVAQLSAELTAPVGSDTLAGLVQVLPLMDDAYTATLAGLARELRTRLSELAADNPYGVIITRTGWAGNGTVLDLGVGAYWLHKAFPEIIEQDRVLRSLSYVFGTHPDSNYSFVSGIGSRSQTQAYGGNRADFSFIPGGIVPGVLVLEPDYPENKSDWPFFWGQNEYVITLGGQYIFLANAADRLLRE